MVFSAFPLIDRRVRHRPAMPGARIDLGLIIHPGFIQCGRQTAHYLRCHPVVGLGQTDMELGADSWRKVVRTVRCIGSQAAAVEGRTGDDAVFRFNTISQRAPD